MNNQREATSCWVIYSALAAIGRSKTIKPSKKTPENKRERTNILFDNNRPVAYHLHLSILFYPGHR